MRKQTAVITTIGALLSAMAAAQQPSTLSSSLGVFVFPANNQTPQQQTADEGACFNWAKSQTGIDPMAIKPQVAAAAPAANPENAGSGAGARGAVKGAAAGTAIGAIAGDTGKGAAIGATAGLMAGRSAKRNAQQQAATEQQEVAAGQQQQAQASIAQQKATYNKAFSACMEGKRYTVK